MRKKSIENYNKYKQFIEQNDGKLLTTLDEFLEKANKSKADNMVKLKILCPSCNKEFERTFSNYSKKDRLKVCSKCSRKGSKRFSEFELNKKLSEKELTLISKYSEYENETSKILVQCICGEVFETTYASIRNSGEIIRCKKCLTEELREKFSYTYKYVYNYFKDNGCLLLTKEYINVNQSLEYIASCGHVETSSFRVFRRTNNFLCKKCYSDSVSGENAYNWNGGYKSKHEYFRGTYEFKMWHKNVFKRDNYTCQCCGVYGGKLNAHHLDGYNWCEEKRTDIDNGITLCKDCHDGFHNTYGRGNNTKEQFEEWIEENQGITETYSIILN